MKYTSIILTLFIVHCTLFIANAQVAINIDNSNPDSSAILDIKSTNKGFLYPRMTTAERDAISNPSIGLTIFNLDDKCTDIYDGNTWMKDCPLVLVPDSLINPWTQKADFSGTARYDAVGFSINGKGYIGTGFDNDSGFKKDFWEYDPTNNSWTQKADFPDTARIDAVGFSINGKGYIGTGQDENFTRKKDFWEYDPTSNTWTKKADFPGTARDGAVGFSINGKGYIGMGRDGSGLKQDFWEYDTTTDMWTQKADFPGTARDRSVGFSINGKGYIGTGFDENFTSKQDFWEYDTTTDMWTQKADFPGTARDGAVGFSINGKGYIGTGFDENFTSKQDFWEYDTTSNTWTRKADFPGTVRDGAVGFSIDSKGYIGTGRDENFTSKQDFWEYDTSPSPTYQSSQPSMSSVSNSVLNDTDNDTKIQVEESSDEDVIRFDIAGREAVNMDNDFPLNIIATPNNRDLLKLFTTADTAAWHLRLQGTSNKDLGFTETGEADHRFVLAAGGNVGIGTANPSTTLDVNGAVTAISFSGDGANLSNVPGDNLGNHTATTTLNLGNNDITNAGSVTATSFSGDGSNLTNLPGDNLGNHTATTTLNLGSNDITNAGSVTATSFSGDGANLSNVPGDNLGNHTATTTLNLGNNDITNAGSVTATSFTGDGSNLTNLPIATTLQDTDADTKIQVEESLDEDVIRFDVAGREVVNMDDDFPINVIATPSNRHLLRLFTTADTAAWHLRLQGTSNKDLGFTETGEADHRLVLQAGGNIGIGIENPNVTLDVNGDIEYTGTITDVSDRRLKENLLPISAVLTKLLQLQAYSYNMIDDTVKTREYGLLAQEVQKVFPELVSNIDAEGEYLGLSYIQLIPILIEGVKELKMENEALKTENKLLQLRDKSVEARLSQLEALLSERDNTATDMINSEK